MIGVSGVLTETPITGFHRLAHSACADQGDSVTAAFDRDSWEQRWSQALREHGDAVAKRPPNAHLTEAVGNVGAGVALDAGCGHGAETLWLAARGWRVTAVDFSATALAHARSVAEAIGADVAERVDWVEGDLATWTPPADHYDLVACLYVHVAGSVPELVRRMATGVAPGGTLFLVGHRPIDPATGAATPAAGQVQVSVDEAGAALDPPAGSSWSPRTVRAPWPAPASTPSSTRDAEPDLRFTRMDFQVGFVTQR